MMSPDGQSLTIEAPEATPGPIRGAMDWARTRIRSFGFLGAPGAFIPMRDLLQLRQDCLIESSRKTGDRWFNIFQHPYFYTLLERRLLADLREKGRLSLLTAFVFRTCRVALYLFDLARFAFRIRPTRYVLIATSAGRENAPKQILTYTRGRLRNDLFSRSRNYGVTYLDVRDASDRGIEREQIAGEETLTWLDRLRFLPYKALFHNVWCETFEETIATYRIFLRYLPQVRARTKILGLFVREGGPPVMRAFVKAARESRLPSATIFTTNRVEPESFVGTDVVSNPSVAYPVRTSRESPAQKVVRIGDYPFLPWREVARKPGPAGLLGFCPEIGTFGMDQKYATDRMVVAAIRDLPKVQGLVMRTHPQEWPYGEANRYYKRLIEPVPNAIMDRSPQVHEFLERIRVLIVSTETSVTEEALLSRRPVVVLREKGEITGDVHSTVAGDMMAICESAEAAREAVSNFLSWSEEELNAAWLAYLARLGFDANKETTIDEFLERFES